jgi:hypothetical protein
MLIAISFSAYFRSIYCGYWPSQICFIFVTLLTISTNTPPKSIYCLKQCKSKNLANISQKYACIFHGLVWKQCKSRISEGQTLGYDIYSITYIFPFLYMYTIIWNEHSILTNCGKSKPKNYVLLNCTIFYQINI